MSEQDHSRCAAWTRGRGEAVGFLPQQVLESCRCCLNTQTTCVLVIQAQQQGYHQRNCNTRACKLALLHVYGNMEVC
jgi:hypothetical protein